MRDQHGLTPKQRKFADLALNIGNGTKAALAVYDTDDYDTGSAISSENLRKPKIAKYIADQCKIAGLTTPKVLLRLSEQLDATKTLQTSDGQVLGEKPDHLVRHKAIETCIKYVLPEFLELHRQGGLAGAGAKHLHLHDVQIGDLLGIAGTGKLPEDEPASDN